MTETISWDDFSKVELKIGTVVRAEEFPEARKPAYIVWVDFGGDLGVRISSAQITVHYTPEELIGRQIVAVVNFPPMQIGPIKSEFLLTVFYDEDCAVVIAQPGRPVPNGARLV